MNFCTLSKLGGVVGGGDFAMLAASRQSAKGEKAAVLDLSRISDHSICNFHKILKPRRVLDQKYGTKKYSTNAIVEPRSLTVEFLLMHL